MGLDRSCDSLRDQSVFEAGRRHHHKPPRHQLAAAKIARSEKLFGRGNRNWK
jgi:hypothetical protein